MATAACCASATAASPTASMSSSSTWSAGYWSPTRAPMRRARRAWTAKFDALAARGLAVQIDVKEASLAPGIAAALARHGLGQRSFVSTPSLRILREFAAAAPALPRSLSYPSDRLGLSNRPAAAPLVRAGIVAGRVALPARLPQLLRSVRASAVTLDHRVVSNRAIEVCHRLGVAVIVWTVNEPALATSLVASGIDAIITDDPGIVPAGPSTP